MSSFNPGICCAIVCISNLYNVLECLIVVFSIFYHWSPVLFPTTPILYFECLFCQLILLVATMAFKAPLKRRRPALCPYPIIPRIVTIKYKVLLSLHINYSRVVQVKQLVSCRACAFIGRAQHIKGAIGAFAHSFTHAQTLTYSQSSKSRY